ncbi:glutamate receptor 1-like [Aphis craccivora]|uniref:Glutamate receptor 1-like n=1 Tax=Aphis craccivora TaxID=307492 RepID=A0A6G0VSD1_APHCR|nr:glutamate receptor 1-like [Aphis craccivora]
MEGLTGHIMFNDDGKRYNYTLHVVQMTIDSTITKIAEWSDTDGFKTVVSKPERVHTSGHSHKGNATLIVATVMEEPFIMFKKPKYGESLAGNDRFEGYCKDLTTLLADKIGVKYPHKKLIESHLILDSKRSEECIDFTMIMTSRKHAPISNYGGGFRCKSEYPWCIIEVKS